MAEQNQILLPKANALDRLSDARGAYCLRDAAKQLNTKPKHLNEWLEANKWCFKNGRGERVASQTRINLKLMTTKGGESNGHAYTQPLITAKGVAKLAVEYPGGES